MSAICCARCGGCCNIDDPERVRLYREMLDRSHAAARIPARRAAASPAADAALRPLGNPPDVPAAWTRRSQALWSHAPVRAELAELLGVLDARSQTLARPAPCAPEVPLHVHARYTRDEILGAYGEGSPATAAGVPRGRPLHRIRRDRRTARHAEEGRARLLADDDVPRLRDRADAVPLGVAVDAGRRVADDSAVRAARAPGSHDRVVRSRPQNARERRRIALRLPRPRTVRELNRRSPGRIHVAARDADAGGALRSGSHRRRRLSSTRARDRRSGRRGWRSPGPRAPRSVAGVLAVAGKTQT